MIRLFLFSLRNRWFEYLTASVVVAFAVAALAVQGSLASSAEKQVHDLAHHLGKNMLVIPAALDLGEYYSLEYGDATVPDSYPEQLMNSPLAQHIQGIQPSLMGNVEVSGQALVLVGEPDLPAAMRWDMQPGVTPAAVGDSAARKLGLKLGDSFMVAGSELRVALVADSLPDGLDMAVFTDLPVAQELLGKPGAINAMHIGGCWCSIDVAGLAAKVELELPDVRAITVAGVIESQQGAISTVKRYSKTLSGVAVLLIVGITLVLTTAQIRRQRREIGLLLAIGAPAWTITIFFTAMAALIGAVGGVAGLLLGGPLTSFVANRFMDSPLPVSADMAAPILLPTILASVLAALAPAAHAARTDPTVTLREL